VRFEMAGAAPIEQKVLIRQGEKNRRLSASFKKAPPLAVPVPPPVAPPAKSSNALLEAMKDELFQLEIERQQGQSSAEEYEKQKAALDQTLKRALARVGKNS